MARKPRNIMTILIQRAWCQICIINCTCEHVHKFKMLLNLIDTNFTNFSFGLLVTSASCWIFHHIRWSFGFCNISASHLVFWSHPLLIWFFGHIRFSFGFLVTSASRLVFWSYPLLVWFFGHIRFSFGFLVISASRLVFWSYPLQVLGFFFFLVISASRLVVWYSSDDCPKAWHFHTETFSHIYSALPVWCRSALPVWCHSALPVCCRSATKFRSARVMSFCY